MTDTFEEPVVMAFTTQLDALDEHAARFLWENFDPQEANGVFVIPRSVWNGLLRPTELTIMMHGPTGDPFIQSSVKFTDTKLDRGSLTE